MEGDIGGEGLGPENQLLSPGPWGFQCLSCGDSGGVGRREEQGTSGRRGISCSEMPSHGLWERSHMGCPVLSDLCVPSPGAGQAVG